MQFPHPTSALLDVSNLSKTFSRAKRAAIDDVCLSIAAGEILGFVGLNGAGKTTTIRIAAGLSKPSAGRVFAAGFDIVQEKARASRHIGMVPEFPNFDPSAKATSLLRYFAGFRGIHGKQAADRCSSLLEDVGLDASGDYKFRALSQGMKKRLALAVAMLGDPEILLLDEVLNGLDPQGIVLVRNLMIRWRNEGKAILLSSHLLNETQLIADRVAILHEGRLIKVLSRSEIAESTSGALRLAIVDVDTRVLEYLATKGSIRSDGISVWISDPTASAEEINSELVRRGYHVKSLSFEPTSLESLFLDLIDESSAKASDTEESK
jgi:ABC-2 type transport system ATP-binding protein